MKVPTAFLAGFLLVGAVIPAHAQVDGIIGSPGEDSLVTVGSGPASSSGTVNVGVGGGDGNVVDANVGGGSTGLAKATVGANRRTGSALDADVDLLNNSTRANVNIGGSGAGASVGIGSTGGAGGTAAAPATTGTGNSTRAVTSAAVGSGGTAVPACMGDKTDRVVDLIQSTAIDGSWQQATGVEVEPVLLCPDARAWLAAQLASSQLGDALRAAVQADALISASLDRSHYGPEHVFAVDEHGDKLTVYVY